MKAGGNTLNRLSFSTSPRPTVASWILVGIAMFLVLYLHMLSALLAGLLVYELVHLLAPRVEKRLTNKGSRFVALAALSVLTIIILIFLTFGTLAFFKSDTGNVQALLDKVQHILTDARTKLPPWIVDNFPGNVDDLKSFATDWLDEAFQRGPAPRKGSHAFFRPRPGGYGHRSVDLSA